MNNTLINYIGTAIYFITGMMAMWDLKEGSITTTANKIYFFLTIMYATLTMLKSPIL